MNSVTAIDDDFEILDDADVPEQESRRTVLVFIEKQRWWVTRVAVLPIHLAVWALVVFFLVRLIPGNPVVTVTGGQFTPQIYARVKKALGLDGSLPHQLGTYFDHLVHLQLGHSILSGDSVLSDEAIRMPATLELALQCMIAVSLCALIASYITVMHPRWMVSRVCRVYARTAGSIPEFCVGIALISIFYAGLHWAPAPLGRTAPTVQQPSPITGMPLLDSVLHGDWTVTRSMLAHLVLPISVSVIAQTAVLIKLLIAGLEEAVTATPTLFRIASGASRRVVLLSIYRRALPATVAMFGMLFGSLLGGAVILENLFGFTGMGQYMVDAVNGKDLPVMEGFLISIAAVSLVVFLLVDLLNMLLDPRRKPGIQRSGR